MWELQSKAGSVSEGPMASVLRKERVKRLRVDSACNVLGSLPQGSYSHPSSDPWSWAFFPATPFLYEADSSDDASPLPTFNSSQLSPSNAGTLGPPGNPFSFHSLAGEQHQ